MLITLTPKFEEVSELEFYTYLEDIKNKLKKDAPEWHINSFSVKDPQQTLYNVCRWDFTKGRDQVFPYDFFEGVFAYTVTEDSHEHTVDLIAPPNSKYYLLNKHPIIEKTKQ